jgi:hypothetical protein
MNKKDEKSKRLLGANKPKSPRFVKAQNADKGALYPGASHKSYYDLRGAVPLPKSGKNPKPENKSEINRFSDCPVYTLEIHPDALSFRFPQTDRVYFVKDWQLIHDAVMLMAKVYLQGSVIDE